MNLLLLYGWLRQEKPFRVYRDSVEVFWAHLMDRDSSRSQEFFFQEQVLSCHQFWGYLRVPYSVLLESLAVAGQALRAQIREAVQKADPRLISKMPPVAPAFPMLSGTLFRGPVWYDGEVVRVVSLGGRAVAEIWGDGSWVPGGDPSAPAIGRPLSPEEIKALEGSFKGTSQGFESEARLRSQ
jgi:hypothetical protein